MNFKELNVENIGSLPRCPLCGLLLSCETVLLLRNNNYNVEEYLNCGALTCGTDCPISPINKNKLCKHTIKDILSYYINRYEELKCERMENIYED